MCRWPIGLFNDHNVLHRSSSAQTRRDISHNEAIRELNEITVITMTVYNKESSR